MRSQAKDPIVIIGAGIGGLSAAIQLAVAGQRVIVLEKNPHVGGKMGQLERDGFRWDTGPSVITMRHIFEKLFATAGKKLEDYLTFLPIDPLTRYFYPDGAVLDINRDLQKTIEQIKKIAPGDVAGYQEYLNYTARIHEITGQVFIYNHPPTLSSFTHIPIRDWLKADPFRTMDGAIRHFVASPYLRQLLGRFATYVGGSPYLAPATLNVIADVELNSGVWYPQGGIYTIAESLARLARELGVEICMGSAVEQINVVDDYVVGVTLKTGHRINTKQVLANVDVTTVYKHLLPPSKRVDKRLACLTRFEPSCSAFILMLGIEGTFPQLAHHNILFSRDYQAEFAAIFKKHIPAEEPTIYIAITSKTDPSHAPEGCENWFVLVNVPAISNQFDWEKNAPAYRDTILDQLAAAGFDVRGKIRVEEMLTPSDLEQMTGAWRGALYGPSPNSKWTAFRRPHNRDPNVRGLYFAGGTTHPGGGVPMVMLSGKVAAEIILDDL